MSIVGTIGTAVGLGAKGVQYARKKFGEKTKGVPKGVPPSPQRGQQVGTIHNGEPGAWDHSHSAPLYVGLHDYDYLSGHGLHDAVSYVDITEPVTVWLFEGVEEGKPAGKSIKIKGPTTVSIDRLRSEGMENEISSIAVRSPVRNPPSRSPQTKRSPSTRRSPSAQASVKGASSGSGGASGESSISTSLLIGVAALLFITTQS